MKCKIPANDNAEHLREKAIQLQIQEYFDFHYPDGHPNDPAKRRTAIKIVPEYLLR